MHESHQQALGETDPGTALQPARGSVTCNTHRCRDCRHCALQVIERLRELQKMIQRKYM